MPRSTLGTFSYFKFQQIRQQKTKITRAMQKNAKKQAFYGKLQPKILRFCGIVQQIYI